MSLPTEIENAVQRAHPSWHAALNAAIRAVQQADAHYLNSLVKTEFLPTQDRLFAAFSLPMDDVRFVLVGEGPYPREESATGYCFMDGAVQSLWSDESGGGLSKKVNRATSLRNFMKMLLVASRDLSIEDTGVAALSGVAEKVRQSDLDYITSLSELQSNMLAKGFLLLNASPVFRQEVAPIKDARAWQPFLQVIFAELQEYQQRRQQSMALLVLWGKIAEQLKQIPATGLFPHIAAEHPYNLSFIANQHMQDFFRPMELLKKFPQRKFL
ncbi:uracil-DNA glycosylase [Undibacterium sp. SXout7W]|uniref:uracil-DNA glycosylase n=1 Tax=Undibacterium sp. SXout7W TaxID=3413049 RepID=UPI003BF15496